MVQFKPTYTLGHPWIQSKRNSPDSPDISGEFWKMSGEEVWSCRTKSPASIKQGQCPANRCPAKSLIIAGHFTVKCPSRLKNVQQRTAGSSDKMSSEAQTNFAYSIYCGMSCAFFACRLDNQVIQRIFIANVQILGWVGGWPQIGTLFGFLNL